MKPPLYKTVHKLALDIVNASANENDIALTQAYAELHGLCYANEESNNNHPLQWEALGDFSDTFTDAMLSYSKGLKVSKELNLDEYKASILFAMAELNLANDNIDKSKSFAVEASSISHCNIELKDAIVAFVQEYDHT